MASASQNLQSPGLKFDHVLRDHIRSNLSVFEARTIQRKSRKHAAVAITLISQKEPARIGNLTYRESESDQAAFILTIRGARLSKHAGQRAFPGGRLDPGESAIQSALRELKEEVGLEAGPEQVLGTLDDYTTRSGFVITPVVVWGGSADRLSPNPSEVESIHRVPLGELLRPDAPILETGEQPDSPVLKMPVGDDWFAAPTAAMAYQFREVALLGRDTRVNHYDEPLFAWK